MNCVGARLLFAILVLAAGILQAREISSDDAIDEVGRFSRGKHGKR